MAESLTPWDPESAADGSDPIDYALAGPDSVWWYVDVYDVYEEWISQTKLSYTQGG